MVKNKYKQATKGLAGLSSAAFLFMSPILIGAINKNSVAIKSTSYKNNLKQIETSDDSFVLQTAKEDTSETKRFQEDLKKYSLKEYENKSYRTIKHKITRHNSFIDSTHKYSVTVNFDSEVSTMGYYSHDYWKANTVKKITVEFLTSSNTVLFKTHKSINLYVKGASNGHYNGYGSKYLSSTFDIDERDIPSNTNQNISKLRVIFDSRFHEDSGKGGGARIGLTYINWHDKTTNKNVYAYDPDHVWTSLHDGNHGNNGNEHNYSQSLYINLNGNSKHINSIYDNHSSINFKTRKIFMSNNYFRNAGHLSKAQLASLITWKGNAPFAAPSKTSTLYDSLSIDSSKKVIKGRVKFKLNSNEYTDYINFELPIHVVSFNYLTKASKESASMWNHSSDGSKKYWNSAPSTKLILNNEYFKTLKIVSGKQILLDRLNRDVDWNWVGNDKQAAIKAINSYSLNQFNYELTKIKYLSNKSTWLFEQLKVFSNFNEIVLKNSWDHNIPNIDDYLYILKKANISYSSSVINNKISENKKIHSKPVATFDEKIILDGTYLRNTPPTKTTFTMKVSDIKLENIASTNIKIDGKLLNWLDEENLKRLYDLKLTNTDNTSLSFEHTYFFQNKPMNISSDISFVLEDGTILDSNLIVLHSSNPKLAVGDKAYLKVRFKGIFKGGREENIIVIKKSGKWYSPKYQKNLEDLIANFKEENIEYIFNQEMNLLINPYDLGGKSLSPGVIDKNTRLRYSINKVEDIYNGQNTILEDWHDGYWSHAIDPTGKAIFDGIFGSDISGHIDKRGHLDVGSHNIKININNSPSGFKSHFKIVIDKNPVKIEVSSVDSSVIKKHIKAKDPNTGETKNYEMFYSQGAINMKVFADDLASAKAETLGSDGNWYSIPINIINYKKDGRWLLAINSTVDYAGFSRVTVTDQAGNYKIIYFKLDKSENEYLPNLLFKKEDIVKNDKKHLGQEVIILNKASEAIISDPLVNDVSIERVSHNGTTKPATFLEVEQSKFTSTIPKGYGFGNTLLSNSHLKYAGDELKPFLDKNLSSTWTMVNKKIKFKLPGLYRIQLKNKLIYDSISTKYVYIKESNMTLSKFLPQRSSEKETVNYDTLPTIEGKPLTPPGEHEENIYKSNIDIEYWDFLIKNVKAEFSYMWYTEFFEKNILKTDLHISDEGKWKIHMTNIFGQHLSGKFLILDKDKLFEERLKSGSLIAKDKSHIDKTAFWKGRNIWNVIRYEDEDHAIWEMDEFIKEAMKHGLTKEQAKWLYFHAKLNPKWNGDYSSISEKEKGWLQANKYGYLDRYIKEAMKSGLTKEEAEWEYNHLKWNPKWDGHFKALDEDGMKSLKAHFVSQDGLSKGSIAGIVVGTLSAIGLIGGISVYLIIKRIKNKAIT